MSGTVVKAMLFGKLPAHGDFVCRGLDAAEREQWDAFLTASLEAARERMGDAFEQHYDAAPPYRFFQHASALAGSVAPSVDAAGRRFPLMVAVCGLSPGQAEAGSAAMEGLIYAALAECWAADRLHLEAGKETGVPEREAAAIPCDRWWVDDTVASGFPRFLEAFPMDLMTAMAGPAEIAW